MAGWRAAQGARRHVHHDERGTADGGHPGAWTRGRRLSAGGRLRQGAASRPQLRRIARAGVDHRTCRSEEHTSELQSLMRISYAVFCLKKKNTHKIITRTASVTTRP